MENELPKEDETQEEPVVPENNQEEPAISKENQEQESVTPENSLDSMESSPATDSNEEEAKEEGFNYEREKAEFEKSHSERREKFYKLSGEIADSLGMHVDELEKVYDELWEKVLSAKRLAQQKSAAFHIEKVLPEDQLQMYQLYERIKATEQRLNDEYMASLRELDAKKKQSEAQYRSDKLSEMDQI